LALGGFYPGRVDLQKERMNAAREIKGKIRVKMNS